MTHYSNTSNPVDFPKLSTVDRLWGEALDKAVPETYTSLSWTQVEKIKSVFAELIVQECAKLANEETSLPYDSYSEKIKKHFGVEE